MSLRAASFSAGAAVCMALVIAVAVNRSRAPLDTVGAPLEPALEDRAPLRDPAGRRPSVDGAQGRDASEGPAQPAVRDEPSAETTPRPTRSAAPGGPPAPPVSSASSDAPPTLDEIQLSSDSSAEVMPVVREVEREFSAQNKDPAWSPAMEARILSELSAEPGARYTGIQVDCRTTLCRVQLTLPVGAPPVGALPAGTPPVGSPPVGALPAGAPPARPAGASPDAPGGIFAVADALGLEFHIVLAAFDGYGTPTTLAFLKRPAEAETPAP